MAKLLKTESKIAKEFEELFNLLSEKKIVISVSADNTLIISKGKANFKYVSEGEPSTEFPPVIEGRFVLCDENGNDI
jgi:uncharacterized protein with ATP-grasp and redox domains